jgi:hypothetical protein
VEVAAASPSSSHPLEAPPPNDVPVTPLVELVYQRMLQERPPHDSEPADTEPPAYEHSVHRT